VTAQSVFTQFRPELRWVLDELRRREPIFHRREFGATQSDFEKTMVDDYWEVGASGRRYSRHFILQMFVDEAPIDAATAGWRAHDFGLQELSADTYLLTYTLRQGERVTRRATIWRLAEGTWRILYHQGTIVLPEEDNVKPDPV
jgi:hypothetical protein